MSVLNRDERGVRSLLFFAREQGRCSGLKAARKRLRSSLA